MGISNRDPRTEEKNQERVADTKKKMNPEQTPARGERDASPLEGGKTRRVDELGRNADRGDKEKRSH